MKNLVPPKSIFLVVCPVSVSMPFLTNFLLCFVRFCDK